MDIDDLIPEVSQEVVAAPELLIRMHLQKKLREFFKDSRCWFHEPSPVQLIQDQSRYVFAAPAGAQVIGVKSIRRASDGRGLLDTKESAMNSVSQTWRVEKQDPPTRYIPEFDPRQVAVYPTPSSNPDSIIPKLVLAQSSSATSVPDWIDDFRDGIVAGVVGSLQRLPGRPWTSLKDAGDNDIKFRDAISSARVRVAKEGSRAPETARFKSFEEL